MIRVEISALDQVREGIHGVCLTLRKAGIPVRVGPNNELRHCPVWNAKGTRLIGKGFLSVIKTDAGLVFEYDPPIDSFEDNVIDVDARVVQDALRLDNKLPSE